MACISNKTCFIRFIGQAAVQGASTASQREQLAPYAFHIASYYANFIAGKNLRTGVFFLPDGRDQNLVSSTVREQYEDPRRGISQHVHKIEHAREDPTKSIFVVKDTVNKTGWYDEKGHVYKVEVRNVSPELRDQAFAHALSVLNARLSGRKGH